MAEKLLTAIEFRCDFEMKAQIEALAAMLDVTKSDFVRMAVEKELTRHKSMHIGYQEVFGCSEEQGATASDNKGEQA